ncbi:MAG: energy transducer TonB [Steroidobacterales bacterium]
MTAYVHDSTFFTRRTMVLFAIIALHVFIFWALATGLARKAIEVLAPPIQTEIVQEEVKQNQPPPPPPPQFEKPPVEVPPPDVTIDMPTEAPATNAITAVVQKSNQPAPPPRPSGPSSPPKPGKNFPNSDDFYPDASRRLNEEGMAVVHACVGANGKVTEAPTLAKSSGSPRIDGAAVKLAQAGSGRYQPALQDGKPVDACFDFGIRFKLRQ